MEYYVARLNKFYEGEITCSRIVDRHSQEGFVVCQGNKKANTNAQKGVGGFVFARTLIMRVALWAVSSSNLAVLQLIAGAHKLYPAS